MANPNKLPIVEVFGPTIQGEGAMIGKQTMFVRSAHCDYLCSKCDSLFAVIPDRYKPIVRTLTTEELWQEVNAIRGHCTWITLSGGNPALWDFSQFVHLARRNGVSIAVETQGSIFKEWLADVDVLTVSPKGPGMGIDPDQSLRDLSEFMEKFYFARKHQERAYRYMETALKIPVFGEPDLDFAEKVRTLNPWVPLYLSVGNPYPPGQDGHFVASSFGEGPFKLDLLEYLNTMTNSVLLRPALKDAIILPQLHVLLYGNRQGV